MNGTKAKMAEAFKALVCRKYFHKITISDIAKECQMTRENFYYHFRDKYDILRWIFSQDIVSKLPGSEESFEVWIEVLIDLIEKDYGYYKKTVKDVEADEIRQNLYPIMEQRIRILMQKSIDDSVWNMRKEKEDFLVEFFTDSYYGFFMSYFQDHEKMDAELLKSNFRFLNDNFLMFVKEKGVENYEKKS